MGDTEFNYGPFEVDACNAAHSVGLKAVPHGDPPPCPDSCRLPGCQCFLIASNLGGVDLYIVHCPYGPPCP